VRLRPGPAAAAAAALAAVAPGAGASEDPASATQAARAEALMDRLQEGRGDPGSAGDREAVLREARVLVAECLEIGNYRTAEYVAGQIAAHHPDLLEAEHRYAKILVARGERAKAERDLREHLKARPTDCTAYGLLAGLLESEGRAGDVLEVHEAHLREHPGDAGALYERARLTLWTVRDPAAARREIARMREAAGRPGADGGQARFLRENAGILEQEAARMEADRGTLRAAERRLDRLLWAAVAGFALLLAAAGWGTRQR
jgi:hypothetical protein